MVEPPSSLGAVIFFMMNGENGKNVAEADEDIKKELARHLLYS
jgi:hypothetical protein